ncbi:hypothetical protein ACFPZI_14015 [Streptomyces chlorus]|uniref:Uncharacterized protein n=1 Tax=Streptomyces chlorus TaxID=887452 RepID=A0ABW1DWD3_9ACTN
MSTYNPPPPLLRWRGILLRGTSTTPTTQDAVKPPEFSGDFAD